MVTLGKNPLICQSQVLGNYGKHFFKTCFLLSYQREKSFFLLFLYIHKEETGSIPNLIHKVSAGFHTAMIETHIISGSISGKKRHSQGICPVSTDDFQRIDSVSQGLTHLSSLIVSHQTVDQYLLKRCLSGLLNSGEYHSDYPEENDVIAGNQHIRRIEILVILRLLRPAQSLKGPKGTGEPGIQGILILMKGGTLTLWTRIRLFQGYD